MLDALHPGMLLLLTLTCNRPVPGGVQAAQVRKSSFAAHGNNSKAAYHPETHHSCTIHAGTVIQQVQYAPLMARPAS